MKTLWRIKKYFADLIDTFPYLGLSYKIPFLYNLIAASDFPYFFSKQELSDIICAESLKKNSIVLDLACGTGEFSFWLANQQKDIHVIGIDSAESMLECAQKKAIEEKVENVSFFCQLIEKLTKDDIEQHIKEQKLEHDSLSMIVNCFGFSAMRNFEQGFNQALSILPEKSIFCIVDVYRKPSVINYICNFFYDNLLFGADSFRIVYLQMKQQMDQFELYEKKNVPDPLLIYSTITPYIAKGVKKAETMKGN